MQLTSITFLSLKITILKDRYKCDICSRRSVVFSIYRAKKKVRNKLSPSGLKIVFLTEELIAPCAAYKDHNSTFLV